MVSEGIFFSSRRFGAYSDFGARPVIASCYFPGHHQIVGQIVDGRLGYRSHSLSSADADGDHLSAVEGGHVGGKIVLLSAPRGVRASKSWSTRSLAAQTTSAG